MNSKHLSSGIIQEELHIGEPISYRDRQLFPTTRTLRIDLPGRAGGVIWNRPVGVLIHEPGQKEDHWAPIIDLTRRTQVAIWGGVVFVILVAWMINRRRSQ